MKTSATEFSILGGSREFHTELPVGQLYFPAWERYEQAMRGIIERRYYTNHGPLVKELEARLEDFLHVRNAVTVSNATIGLYLVELGLGLKGRIMMPSFSFIATAQAAVLAGLDVTFCDVDPSTHQVTPATADRAVEAGVSAICPVNLWGGSTDIGALTDWANDHEVALFFDSAHGFGVETRAGKLGTFGRAEVFSFHATKVLSATEGGCICTEDDDLAERIRNMRSNYGIRRPLQVPLTVNARMSEGQAAVAIAGLDELGERIAHNRAVFDAYRSAVSGLPGIRLLEPSNTTWSNYQSAVLQVSEDEYGMSRNSLWSVLRAEGVLARRYFKPGIHRSVPFEERYPQYLNHLPTTDQLCDTVMQLPIGSLVTSDDAGRIGQLVVGAHQHADALRAHAG
ncbi:MAG TPA: aminotransferase class I/II-fold pyridoxal phosphate-dependent enzyme [Acidimicrobiales bacterium]|nr:aminotransferase class I/II-fold pyridoxal phosphate-dependent enzyme [Acidimicrobiales bacterium]